MLRLIWPQRLSSSPRGQIPVAPDDISHPGGADVRTPFSPDFAALPPRSRGPVSNTVGTVQSRFAPGRIRWLISLVITISGQCTLGTARRIPRGK